MNYKLFFFCEVPFVVSPLEFDRETTFWAVFVVSLLSFDSEITLLGSKWQVVRSFGAEGLPGLRRGVRGSAEG